MKFNNPIDKIKIKSLEKEVERLRAENLHVRHEFRKFEKFAAQLFAKQPAQSKIQRLNKKTKTTNFEDGDDSPETYLNRMLYLADACLEIEHDVEADIYLAMGELPLLAANLLSGFDGQRVIYDCIGIPDYVAETNLEQGQKSISLLLRRVFADNCQHCRSIIGGSPMLTDHFKAMQKQAACIESFSIGSKNNRPSSTLRDLCGIRNGKLLLFYSAGNVFQIETLIDAVGFLPDDWHLAIVLLKKIDNLLQQKRLAKKIQETSFGQRIHLLEEMPDEDPVSFAGSADLAIVLQNMKSLPQQLALPEYVFDFMAANLPICCTATDPARYLMPKYPRGKLIVRHAPEELAKTLAEVLSVDDRQTATKREMTEDLAWESQIDNFMRIIGSDKKVVTVIAGNTPPPGGHRIVNMIDTLLNFEKKVNIITSGKSLSSRYREIEAVTVYNTEPNPHSHPHP